MRRLIALIGALAIIAGLPAAASGARSTRFTDQMVSISCDPLTATAGRGSASFSASVSDQFGPRAFVQYWTADAPSGPPDLSGGFDSPAQVTWNGTTLSGSIPLTGTTQAATFSVVLTPSGDPITFDESFEDGNHQHRFSGTFQPLDPRGNLNVGGATFSLDGCFADETTVSSFDTNPTSIVNKFSSRSIGCEISNAAGDTAFLNVYVEGNIAQVNVFVDPNGPGPDVAGFGEGILVGGALDFPLTLFDPRTGEPVTGSGGIQLSVASAGVPFEFLIRNATTRERVRGVFLDVEGSLTVRNHEFNLGDCVLQDATTKRIVTFPNGPKPGGKVPPNDLPTGAKLLRPGERTTVATKGASPDREATYECLAFEDPETGTLFEIPVGHTVWYKVAGTGNPITIDTAGSDYDTVIAVYTADGAGGFTPVPGACVDDVAVQPIGFSLQASVTFASQVSVTYYVQIGGFPQAFPYGNLRVKVS